MLAVNSIKHRREAVVWPTRRVSVRGSKRGPGPCPGGRPLFGRPGGRVCAAARGVRGDTPVGSGAQPRLSPILSIQRPVLYRLGDLGLLDLLEAVQVGDGARWRRSAARWRRWSSCRPRPGCGRSARRCSGCRCPRSGHAAPPGPPPPGRGCGRCPRRGSSRRASRRGWTPPRCACRCGPAGARRCGSGSGGSPPGCSGTGGCGCPGCRRGRGSWSRPV